MLPLCSKFDRLYSKSSLSLMPQFFFRPSLRTNVSPSTMQWFAKVRKGPPDPILGINDAFKKDKNPNKINVGVGAYRDDNGKPWVLPSIRLAELKVFEKQLNKEYLPITGLEQFTKHAIELALGKDSCALLDQRNATTQSISGTGALSIGAGMIARHFEGLKEIHLPNPTWTNHGPIFQNNGVSVKYYRYFNPQTKLLDFDGLTEDICKMPSGSILLLHACAHNPTGVDLSRDQWSELLSLVEKQKVFPFFDMAYQGFATGDIDNDAFAVRLFEKAGCSFFLAQSFAKNMGLYGERAGAFTAICSSKDEADRLLSQTKILIRSMYSNPPLHGVRLAAEILNDEKLKCMWIENVKTMANRIIGNRKSLVENLQKAGSTKDWSHITKQIGMFCYSGLTANQCEALAKDFGIYMTKDGRISMSGITTKNVKYMADAMHQVTS